MECLRSFSIGISQGRTFNVGGTNVKTWGTLGNYHWIIVEQGGVSTYNIQGFKKIDVYGMTMVGNVQTDAGLNDGAIVEDFSFDVSIGGTVPLISGNVNPSPNFYAISQNVGNFQLGKYSNEVKFASPYSGTNQIVFNAFRAQGNNGETLNSISLDLNLQFIVYYKFEGE